ncbi:YggS family pyridoxal phosphate-dependent enzyme [Rothia uropygialis]|uniref:YggS family pyridoxal phosphate-dependent enzyme n=1 Tax=Kocuria sp. 36 TaxID=1415402 RepID=UPI00101D2998|nr:YggS family pyridoxal phosphate-dependent enzyme [Kocuria sp. 36]
MDSLAYSPERSRELADAYARVQADVERLVAEAPDDVRPSSRDVELIVVTKFFPASDAAALYDAGVRSFGENRDQEASAKAFELSQHTSEDPPAWHYIGQLQSNKAKSVVKYASSVQSIDRISLVNALGKAYRSATERFEAEEGPAPAAASRGGLECLVQVGLEDAAATPGAGAHGARGGADPKDLEEIADRIAATDGLVLGGLMAVAPLGEDSARAFEKLWGLSARLRETYPQAWKISSGMSADMSEAIRWGSTSVRVGSAIMGQRPPHI